MRNPRWHREAGRLRLLETPQRTNPTQEAHHEALQSFGPTRRLLRCCAGHGDDHDLPVGHLAVDRVSEPDARHDGGNEGVHYDPVRRCQLVGVRRTRARFSPTSAIAKVVRAVRVDLSRRAILIACDPRQICAKLDRRGRGFAGRRDGGEDMLRILGRISSINQNRRVGERVGATQFHMLQLLLPWNAD